MAKLALFQGMGVLEYGLLPAPHKPQPCLVLLIVMQKCLDSDSRDFEGHRKQGGPALAGRMATFIRSVFQTFFRYSSLPLFLPRAPHADVRGERHLISSFKMRKSRPRVVFLHSFIIRDLFHYSTCMNPPVCKPLPKCSAFIK